MTIRTLRKHQATAKKLATDIHNGLRDDKVTVAYVTPGGGKTLMASLFAHELLKRDVARVLVVCPRITLQTQMRDGFTVPSVGLHAGLRVGYSPSKTLFREDRAGCVTTYQAIAEDPGRWLRFVQEEPTLVVLDEAHHCPRGHVVDAEDAPEAQWTEAVKPIVEAARRVLLMTGTLRRNKGEPIAFVDYDDERKPVAHVKYTRRDALEEKAVLNVSVQLADGEARYWHPLTRQHHTHRLSAVGSRDESSSLGALLDSESYRTDMLKLAIGDLARYRSTRNPHARMIVICHSQPAAESVAAMLKEDGSYRPVLAISKEPTANARIARFRDKGEGEILVTVGMAYEGLDVPDCTHLVCLSRIRARSWLEQALSRVTRFDPKCGLSWEEQCGYIYVPNDPSMVQFLAEWIDEQDAAYADPPIPRDGTGESIARRAMRMVAEDGQLDGVRYADTYGVFSEIDQRRIALVKARFPFLDAAQSSVHLLAIGRALFPDDAGVPSTESAAE